MQANRKPTYVLVGFMSSTRRSKACLAIGVAAETVEELWLAVSLSRTVEGGEGPSAHHIDKLCLTSPPWAKASPRVEQLFQGG